MGQRGRFARVFSKGGYNLNNNIKALLQEKVISELDLSKEPDDIVVADIIDRCILEACNNNGLPLKEKILLKRELFNTFRRLDVLTELMSDSDISEIMVNGTENIFIEKKGLIFQTEKSFDNLDKLKSVIQQIVADCNRRINDANPIVDARLKDGSRVNILVPPIALDGPILTIRRFPQHKIDMDRLVELGSIDRAMVNILSALVKAGYNIFISGGTGSGKTTFLNALSNLIPKDERIITIEDSAELQLQGISNLVRLEAREANVEGKNKISIRELIRTSLRMRPDRIVVGEVRDEAAIDMLTAMNTGHDGSLSTGHANSAKDMISRLETMVLMGVDIPLFAVRKQIASAVDIIIHLGRLKDKSRKVLNISEVVGMKEGEVVLSSLFEFVEVGENQGKVVGMLRKVNDLVNINKLCSSGMLDLYKEAQGEYEYV